MVFWACWFSDTHGISKWLCSVNIWIYRYTVLGKYSDCTYRGSRESNGNGWNWSGIVCKIRTGAKTEPLWISTFCNEAEMEHLSKKIKEELQRYDKNQEKCHRNQDKLIFQVGEVNCMKRLGLRDQVIEGLTSAHWKFIEYLVFTCNFLDTRDSENIKPEILKKHWVSALFSTHVVTNTPSPKFTNYCVCLNACPWIAQTRKSPGYLLEHL